MPPSNPFLRLLLLGIAFLLVTAHSHAAPTHLTGSRDRPTPTSTARTRVALPRILQSPGISTSSSAEGSGSVVAWGSSAQGQTAIPEAGWGLRDVAAGGTHTLGLRVDGTVIAWGNNAFGQCAVPTGLTRVRSVAAGQNHSVALRANGTLTMWGLNSSGQTTLPPGLSSIAAVAAGGAHTLALRANGTVAAWGSGGHGQTTVPEDLNAVMGIAAGEAHSVAVRADGTVRTWGRGTEGQTTVPGGLFGVKRVAAGGRHTLALKSDGTVVAWGSNSDGQSQVPAGLAGVIQIAAGEAYSLALRSNGTLVAWGRGAEGQTTLPDGLNSVCQVAAGGKHVVTLVVYALYMGAPGPRAKAIVAGGAQRLGLGADGTLFYQGSWAPPSLLEGVTAVSQGEEFSLALLDSGLIAAWGNDFLGDTNPIQHASGHRAIAAGNNHGLAVSSEGGVVAWGENLGGRTTVPGFGVPVKAVAAGQYHSMALLADGTVRTWGQGFELPSVTPPPGLENVIGIAAGDDHCLALKADGTVVGWGRNDFGQTQSIGLNDVLMLDGGIDHSVGLRADGRFSVWGRNAGNYNTLLSDVTAVGAGGTQVVFLQASAPPTIEAIPDQQMLETDLLKDIEVHISDPNGLGPVSAFAAWDLPGMTQSLTTSYVGGTLTIRVLPNGIPGVFPIRVFASDNNSTAQHVFRLTVISVNDAPSFTGGPNVQSTEDFGPVTVSGWAKEIKKGSVYDSGQQLQFQVVTNNPALFAVPPQIAVSGGHLTFRSAPNAHGTAQITVVIQDDGGTENGGTDTSDPFNFDITVANVDDPMTAHSRAVTTPEDTTIAIDLPVDEVDNDTLTYQITASPAHGTLLGNGSRRTYRPDPNFGGTDSFLFRATDGRTFSNTAEVTITVTPDNDPPTASPKTFVVDEDTPLLVELPASDPERDPFTYELLVEPAHGTLVGTGGFRLYLPDPNYHGTDSLIFRVSDGGAQSDPATVTIQVVSVNDLPQGAPDGPYFLLKSSALNVAAPGLLANDTDADGTSLSAALVTPPAHGTVFVSKSGGFTYVPELGYTGLDTFTYRATDGPAETAPVTVTLGVRAQHPSSTPGAKVSGTGKVSIGGKAATVKASINFATGRITGSVSMTIPRGASYKSAVIYSVVVTGNRARITGKATGPNRSTVDFVVEVEDGGKGVGRDRFRLDVSDGFTTGGALGLTTGNLQVSPRN